eukprot:3541719-Rhodomonas_salina.1
MPSDPPQARSKGVVITARHTGLTTGSLSLSFYLLRVCMYAASLARSTPVCGSVAIHTRIQGCADLSREKPPLPRALQPGCARCPPDEPAAQHISKSKCQKTLVLHPVGTGMAEENTLVSVLGTAYCMRRRMRVSVLGVAYCMRRRMRVSVLDMTY